MSDEKSGATYAPRGFKHLIREGDYIIYDDAFLGELMQETEKAMNTPLEHGVHSVLTVEGLMTFSHELAYSENGEAYWHTDDVQIEQHDPVTGKIRSVSGLAQLVCQHFNDPAGVEVKARITVEFLEEPLTDDD